MRPGRENVRRGRARLMSPRRVPGSDRGAAAPARSLDGGLVLGTTGRGHETSHGGSGRFIRPGRLRVAHRFFNVGTGPTGDRGFRRGGQRES